jgi:hypothetical protein
LKTGDVVTITAHPEKNGATRGATIQIRFADGHVLENKDRWWEMPVISLTH